MKREAAIASAALLLSASFGPSLTAQPTNSAIVFHESAVSASNDYLRENPAGIVAVIRLGGATEVPPERIRRVLKDDFRANGVNDIRFFFDHGKTDHGSSAVFATTTQVHGPYSLAEAREAVAEAARQYLFDQRLSGTEPQ